jgi:hypothetical protein
VIVGVHNDSVVNQRRGMNLPIMNMHERVLSVLGCKVRCTTMQYSTLAWFVRTQLCWLFCAVGSCGKVSGHPLLTLAISNPKPKPL